MEALIKLIVSIKNYDKYIHFIAGIFITTLVGLFNPILGALLTVLLARYKEEYDALHPDKHTYDGWDAAATMAGIPVGLFLLEILTHFFKYKYLISVF